MDKQTFQSLSALLDRVAPQEYKAWVEAGRPSKHPYNDIVRLEAWVDKVAKENGRK